MKGRSAVTKTARGREETLKGWRQDHEVRDETHDGEGKQRKGLGWAVEMRERSGSEMRENKYSDERRETKRVLR